MNQTHPQSTLDVVRAKVIEAIPDEEMNARAVIYSNPGVFPLELADVLRAIADPRVIITSHRLEFRFEGEPMAYWDAAHSLDEQPQEVIDFLAKILLP